MTDKRKGVAVVVFSLLLIPLLAVSLIGFDLSNNFAAMAQEQASSSTASSSSSNQTEIVVAQTPEEQANLDRFDRLDFEAWNNRNWTLFEELHSPDVLVVDFTGNTTRGIDQHLQWAMGAVSAAPESRVLAHPIKIAAGDWTVVTGALPGNLTMVTVAHWEDGRIAEEYLFLQSPPAPMMMNQTKAGQ
jgi:Flp pilus assembly protein TadG